MHILHSSRIKEREKKSFKEVDSDLFPSFSAAANKKVKREEEKCFLLFSYTKAFFFFSENQLGTELKLFFFSDKYQKPSSKEVQCGDGSLLSITV